MNESVPCNDRGIILSTHNGKQLKALIVAVKLIQCFDYRGILWFLEKKTT